MNINFYNVNKQCKSIQINGNINTFVDNTEYSPIINLYVEGYNDFNLFCDDTIVFELPKGYSTDEVVTSDINNILECLRNFKTNTDTIDLLTFKEKAEIFYVNVSNLGKELVFLKQNKNEFPPRIKSVNVSIIKNLTDKKYLNFPECVELSVKTNDDFEIIIHVSQYVFDMKEFHCDVCVNDGVVSLNKDEFDILISKVIPIFDNHDIESHHLAEEKLCNHFKQNLPHICNDYSIKILNCYNE